MNQSKIAVRYAKALFLLAQEKEILENVRADIEMVIKAIRDSDQFRAYLKSPVVKSVQKFKLITEAFGGSINEVTLNFLGIVIRNKREDHLEDIARRFNDVYRNYKGIKSVSITTAISLNEQLKQNLNTLLASVYKADIELELYKEPSILGGFVLKVGDQQYDASVSTGLKKMRKTLLSGTK
jgi:F-type H+-transporting ATPase subunit delta